jgi:hypothetical protein
VEATSGVARALLAHVLGVLHRSGMPTASADVHESDRAGSALFDSARRASGNLELVFH